MKTESSKCRRESLNKQMGRKRRKVDWFIFLPDEILLEILKRVPEVFLRYKVKYVCTKWFNIITKRILLDHASFIFQKFRNFQYCHVDIREEEEGLQAKEQYIDIPFKGMIRSWCNEFVLISGDNNLFVYNLITKEGSYLPQCNNAYCGGHHGCICGVALYFGKIKGIYKVIHLLKGPPLQCEILVLRSGIVSSKWKTMEVPYIDIEEKYFAGDPFLVEGRYLHWDVSYSNYLISLDVVKEEISQTKLPTSGYDHRPFLCHSFETKLPGSGFHRRFVLSSFVIGGKLAKIEKVSRDKAEIWILEDSQKKKWEKLLHSLYVKKSLDIARWPVSSVMSKRYIILESRLVKRLFSYDLKDGVLKELDHIESYDHWVAHSSVQSFI